MTFLSDPNAEELLWWELVADFPELGEGLEEFNNDPESGVVAAVGLFTMLKLRLWQEQSDTFAANTSETHLTDDCPPPGAAGE